MSIPNDWTECEVYEGATIAVKNGVYGAFFAAQGFFITGSCKTRAEARRAVDRWYEVEGSQG